MAVRRGLDLDPAFYAVAISAIEAGTDAVEFLRAARRSYAKAARLASAKNSSKSAQSVSSIAALTGLTRKEIPDLISTPNSGRGSTSSPLLSVVLEWLGSEPYCNKSGIPRILAISEGAVSLKTLISSVAPDVPYASVVKELRSLDLIEDARTGFVRLKKNALELFESNARVAEKLVEMISRFSLSAHFSLKEADSDKLNRFILIDDIPENLARRFFRDFKDRSNALLAAVPKWKEANVRSSGATSDCRRIGLGIYLIEEGENYSDHAVPKVKASTRRAKRA